MNTIAHSHPTTMNIRIPLFFALLLSVQAALAIPVEFQIPAERIKLAASSVFSAQQSPDNLINGSGLSDSLHDNDGSARTMWHTTENPAVSEIAGLRSPAWVKFDFAAPEAFEKVFVWNLNQRGLTNRGFRKTKILATSDGASWQTLAEVELPCANGRACSAIEVPVTARSLFKAVVIAAESNWGGDVYGLGEVRFVHAKDVAEASLPFPASIEVVPQSVYRHRADGKPGREVKLSFKGGNVFSAFEIEIEAAGRKETVKRPSSAMGAEHATILLPPGIGVEKAATVAFTLRAGSRAVRASASVPPKRQWTVLVYPHSHVDIGYTNTKENVEIIHKRNLLNAIELCKKTAAYPEGARYLWNTEVSWPVERYFATASAAERETILDAIRKGWLHVEASYIHDNTSVSSDEELDTLFAPSRVIGELSGVKSDTLVQVDIPGISWGVVPAANRNGVKYCLLWNNGSDRTGRSMDISFRPFWWLGQDGRSKLLVIQPGSYTPGALAKGKFFWPLMAGHTDPQTLLQIVKTDTPRDNFIDDYLWPTLARLENDAAYPYNLFPMSWAMADNTPIDADLPDAVKSWNEEYAYPHLVIASARQILTAFEQKYGKNLPVRQGDFTEYWTDGLGTGAKQTAMNRATKERLVQADTLWALINPSKPAPQADFKEAWRRVLLGSEHTWCYMNPQQQPMQDMIMKTKFSHFNISRTLSEKLLAGALEACIDTQAGTLAVFNTLSWPRTGLAVLPKEIDAASLKDEAGKHVPVQKLATGETVFLAEAVPPLGSRTYRKGAERINNQFQSMVVGPHTLNNGLVKVALDPATGDIVSIVRAGVEFVDKKGGCRVNSYRYLLGHGKPTAGGPQYAAAQESKAASPVLRPALASGPTDVKISIKENGVLVASLVAESKAEGCKWLRREVRLVSGQPHVEIINTLDKLAVTEKEGIHFGFAFDIPNPRMRADIPWGIMEVEKDQFPEGNRNWICFQRWLDISNNGRSVVWTSPDAPTFQVGGMTANIIGPATSSPEWIRTLQPSGTVYSWALNNHWHTNFPLFQEGELTFTYQILPRAAGYDAVRANRFGMEQARPLVAAPVKSGFFVAAPVTVDNPAVAVSSLRQSADGKALILCLRSVSDKVETAKLAFPSAVPKSLHLCLADQVPAEKTTPAVALPPHGVVTVRMEF